MMPESPNPPPITPDELVRLKHKLEPGEYERVEAPGTIILVIRSGMDYPDIVNDIESISDELEFADIKGLTDICIMGNLEIIGIKLDVITTMIEKRVEEDDKIVEALRKKLDNDFGVLLFESEHDPHNKLRLAIHVPMDIKALKSNNLPELLAKVELPARKATIVYIIAEDDYLRLYSNKFYPELIEFAAEQTPRTLEEEQVIKKQVKGGIADHFVEDNREEKSGFQASITEITEKDEADQEQPPPPEEDQPSLPAQVEAQTKLPSGPKQIVEVPPTSQPQPAVPEPHSDMVEKYREVDLEQLLNHLKLKFNEKGYALKDEVIDGVDLIVTQLDFEGQPQRGKQVFIKIIAVPKLRDLINFEKIITKYKIDLGLMITPNPTSEAKIFTVGKKLEVISPDEFDDEVSAI